MQSSLYIQVCLLLVRVVTQLGFTMPSLKFCFEYGLKVLWAAYYESAESNKVFGSFIFQTSSDIKILYAQLIM